MDTNLSRGTKERDPLLRQRRSPNNMSRDYESIESPAQPPILSYGNENDEAPPLLEIPEETYAIRKAALQVLKPLNKTWVRIYTMPGIPVHFCGL